MTKNADPKPPRSVRLPLLTWRQVAELAQRNGQSQSDVIAWAVDRVHVATFGEQRQPEERVVAKGIGTTITYNPAGFPIEFDESMRAELEKHLGEDKGETDVH